MPTEDGFDPDHPVPLFLSGRTDDQERRGTSRILKASILVFAVTVSGVAIALSLGNPVKLFEDATASLTDVSAQQPDANQSTPTIQAAAEPLQSTAGAELSAQTASDAPARDEVAVAPEPAGQTQAENDAPPSGVLLRQFQAWAIKEDARAPVEPAQQDAPAPGADNTPAPAQPVQRHRKVAFANARAEIRHARKTHARVQREQVARAEVRPDARTPDLPPQNAQPPSFLQSLGLRQ